jgi:hypothetical protein
VNLLEAKHGAEARSGAMEQHPYLSRWYLQALADPLVRQAFQAT